jgi:hypothetical protein
MKRICVLIFNLFLLLFVVSPIQGQINPTYQLHIESGGYVDFKIFSLNQYKNETPPISYSDWTRLKITYTDTTAGKQTDAWRLGFKTESLTFDTSPIGSNISVSSISIEASAADSLESSDNGVLTFEKNPQALDNGWTSIIEDGDEGIYRINITYHLDSALIGKKPEYYNTMLIYKMVKTGETFD